MKQNILPILLFFLIIGICGCIGQNTTHNTTPSPDTAVSVQNPLLSKSFVETPRTTTFTPTRTQSPVQVCPDALTTPPEDFRCPRDMPSPPETYHMENPKHPTSKDFASIPVNFPDADRMSLIDIALKDKCVQAFLKSGGDIVGISDQPRPFRKNEVVRWPPALYGYHRVNCTEMLVRFDIDTDAGNISRIVIEEK
jgi:hypothetical protein